MKIRTVFQITLIGVLVLIVVSMATALAAGIEIESNNAGISSIPVDAEDIKPPACSAIQLDNIVSGTGTIDGTEGNDLIVGSPGADTINALGGNDCVLGGSGDDQISGGDGTDVCIGSSGTDTFDACETESQ
jgi:hypothetical protein